MPFEYGKDISFKDQIQISVEGTEEILRILKKHEVKATFFSTATFALAVPDLIRRIVAEGHELSSHGYYHSKFEASHLLDSKQVLEEITGVEIIGYRMARMMPVDEEEIKKAGYLYNSSINPTFLPGRYNNLDKPRTMFYDKSVLQIPASVSPLLRIPLFWLSFHNFPLWLYRYLCRKTLRKDGYLNIYFHPWEFTDLNDKERFGFPGYVIRNSGTKMSKRMERFIEEFKKEGMVFGRICEMNLMSHS